MPPRSIARLARQYGGSSLAELPPAFLAPALYFPLLSPRQHSKFSTSSSLLARDRSRLRGISAIHRSGPRNTLSVSKYPLPEPEEIEKHEKRETNPEHGLWGFFPPNKTSLPTPEEEYAHGRAWTIQELRHKSWDELHSLWWVCARERNRIATSSYESSRLKAGYGAYENENREKMVRATQHAIKHVLRERWYAWNDARELYNDGYRPEKEEFMEEDHGEQMPKEVPIEDLKSPPAAGTSNESAKAT